MFTKIGSLVLLLGLLITTAVPAAANAATATAPSRLTFPLQPSSLPHNLKPKVQQKLPKVERQALRIIGDKLDQTELTEIQAVSAFHIRKVFRKSLGRSAFRSALRISWRESRLLPNVVNDKNKNKTMDWGLFQLNDGGTLQYAGRKPGPKALNPRKNAKAARYIVENAGWGPWGGML